MAKYFYDRYNSSQFLAGTAFGAMGTDLGSPLASPLRIRAEYYGDYKWDDDLGHYRGVGNATVRIPGGEPAVGMYYIKGGNDSSTHEVLLIGPEKDQTGGDGIWYHRTSKLRAIKQPNYRRVGSKIDTIIAEEGTYPGNGRHSNGYWYIRGALANAVPTITLDTTNNRTLYENDILAITGNAKDTDSGNVVSVKYSINGGTIRAIASDISSGANIPFNKSLTFKQNKLFDGETAITGDLAQGAQNTLRVWAEDDQGGKSADQVRTFYVVPNRPATLTINPFSPATDLINTDRVTVSGSVSDPDNNAVKVLYKIANGSFIEIYDGAGGEFSFQVLLSNLSIGINTITIQAKDSYGAITNKTLQITKTENLQPLKTAVARYKLTAPNGTAKGIVLWIEREVGDLVVGAEISMGMNGDAENFVPMTKTATAFVREGIEEDEFTFDAGIAKENIILKLTMTRTSTVSNKGITLISGVLS